LLHYTRKKREGGSFAVPLFFVLGVRGAAVPLKVLANCLSGETPAGLPMLVRAKKTIGLRGRHWRGAAFDAAARAGVNPEKEPKSV
jgi:hypothetical protein